MQAPARCACWLRSGPGPLAAQDRPPQSPPPHRTALLCSSSFGPEAASGAGGPDMGAGAKTGVETVTQFVAAWSQQGANMGWECAGFQKQDQRWQTHVCQS